MVVFSVSLGQFVSLLQRWEVGPSGAMHSSVSMFPLHWPQLLAGWIAPVTEKQPTQAGFAPGLCNSSLFSSETWGLLSCLYLCSHSLGVYLKPVYSLCAWKGCAPCWEALHCRAAPGRCCQLGCCDKTGAAIQEQEEQEFHSPLRGFGFLFFIQIPSTEHLTCDTASQVCVFLAALHSMNSIKPFHGTLTTLHA